MIRYSVVVFLVIILFDHDDVLAVKNLSRQKRCIVIQKQSGGKADSGESTDDEDYNDYKKPQPQPKPTLDRLQNDSDLLKKKGDVEPISPELQKYMGVPPRGMFRRLRLRNRLTKNNFDI